jgi:hypothetical protein
MIRVPTDSQSSDRSGVARCALPLSHTTGDPDGRLKPRARGGPQLDDRPTEDARLLHTSYEHVARTRSARGKAFKRLPEAACFRADVVHTFELSLGDSYVDMRKWKVRVCVCVRMRVCVCV